MLSASASYTFSFLLGVFSVQSLRNFLHQLSIVIATYNLKEQASQIFTLNVYLYSIICLQFGCLIAHNCD